jgi:hypothetical protein
VRLGLWHIRLQPELDGGSGGALRQSVANQTKIIAQTVLCMKNLRSLLPTEKPH